MQINMRIKAWQKFQIWIQIWIQRPKDTKKQRSCTCRIRLRKNMFCRNCLAISEIGQEEKMPARCGLVCLLFVAYYMDRRESNGERTELFIFLPLKVLSYISWIAGP